MTKQQIIEAARTSVAKGEDLQLWQSVEWLYDYGLISYKEYTWFMRAQTETRKTETQPA